MKDIIIIGAGGLGREIYSLILEINNLDKPRYNVVGFVDDAIPKEDGPFKYKYLGTIDYLNSIQQPICATLAIGSAVVRKKIRERITNPLVTFPTLIHPSVIMQNPETIVIGEGVTIAAGCILTCDISIEPFVFLNLMCTVGHDAHICCYSSFMPSVNISGETLIGESVYVGTGAKIINLTSIGDETTIGAGAVVTSDLPKRCTAVGVPAKVIKIREN